MTPEYVHHQTDKAQGKDWDVAEVILQLGEQLEKAEQRIRELEAALSLALTQLQHSPNTAAFARAALEETR